jgi:hypothetical protein
VDASKPFRRTAAGDAEVEAPAQGLSVTQRRILTLLGTPGRLRDLPLGPMVNTARLTRDATRLAQAGLVTYETADPALVAANAASLARHRRPPLARALPLILIASAACAVIWIGWRVSATPLSPDARTRAGAAIAAPAGAGSTVDTQQPPVIATRVLRGDGDRAREAAKDARSAAAKSSAPAAEDPARASGIGSTGSAKPPEAKAPAAPTTASGPELEPDAQSGSGGSNALPER